MIFNRILSFVATITIAGCAVQPYVPAPGSPVAQLTVKNNEVKRRSLSLFLNSKECKDRHFLGSLDKMNSQSFQIPADRELTIAITDIDVSPNGLTYSCVIFSTFFPKSSARYMAELSYSGRSCFMTLLREDGATSVPENYAARQKYQTVWSNSSSFCE